MYPLLKKLCILPCLTCALQSCFIFYPITWVLQILPPVKGPSRGSSKGSQLRSSAHLVLAASQTGWLLTNQLFFEKTMGNLSLEPLCYSQSSFLTDRDHRRLSTPCQWPAQSISRAVVQESSSQQIVLINCYEHRAGWISLPCLQGFPLLCSDCFSFWHNSAQPARWLSHKGNSLSDSFWNFPNDDLFLFWIFLGPSSSPPLNAKNTTVNAHLFIHPLPPKKPPNGTFYSIQVV